MEILPPGWLLNYSAVILNYAIRIFYFIFAKSVSQDEEDCCIAIILDVSKNVQMWLSSTTKTVAMHGASAAASGLRIILHTGGKENSFDLTYRRPSAKHNRILLDRYFFRFIETGQGIGFLAYSNTCPTSLEEAACGKGGSMVKIKWAALKLRIGFVW